MTYSNLRVVLLGISFLVGGAKLCFAGDMEDGMAAYAKQDYETAGKYLKRAAEQGQVTAQRYLAEMYDKGQGLKADYRQAIYWYQQAAAQKDPAAQYRLGIKYANGHGVPMDNIQAYTWFALAFDSGYEKAAAPLKVMLKTMTTEQRQQSLQVAMQLKQGIVVKSK